MIAILVLWSFVAAADGDTLTVREGEQVLHIRLAEIDAPERTQPYSQVSRRQVDTLCRSRPIEFRKVDIDRYGRTVAHVWCNGVHVNWRQVEDGLAWCFPKHLKAHDVCLPLERQARAERRGLWRDVDPLAPWEFRASSAANKEAVKAD